MKSQSFKCPAPAKINWFLHITGRRQDGYHNLQTLFQFVDLCDWLDFTLTSDGKISLTGDTLEIAKEQNLIYLAATALKSYAVDEAGITINIEKNIPSGAGLGGGSSDAATTLLMLNQLWQLQLSIDELAEIALLLGADVPVFVRAHTAFAQGIGEQLTPVILDEPALLLAMPKNCHIGTKDIFGDIKLKRDSHPIKMTDYSFENTRNDCEPVAIEKFTQVAKTLSWLLECAPARMTGTGACCFALMKNQAQAQELAETELEFADLYAVSCLNQSPVVDYVKQVTIAQNNAS